MLVRACLLLCAIAVADRAFVQPDPGTGAGDHLASGLVPIALAGLLAWLLPRLRDGLQALALAGAGTVALTAGVAHGARAIADGQTTAATVLAALAGAGGAVLVGRGAVVAWRSRRDGPAARRWVRRTVRGAAVALGAAFVLVPVCVGVIATARRTGVPAALDLGRPHRDLALTTGDGVRLAASYVPSRNGAAVLVIPGRRSGPVARARMLARHGYGVLLVDARGDGGSEGTRNAFGWQAQRDVATALAYLRARPDVDPKRIAGLGLSVGGEVLLHAAAGDATLRAVVSEGAGTRSLGDQLDRSDLAPWRRAISPWAVQQLAVAVLADASPPPALTGLAARIAPRPVLLIRATDGHEDEVLNRDYARAVGPAATLWETTGGHTGAYDAHPQAYEQRVVGFLDHALHPRRTTP